MRKSHHRLSVCLRRWLAVVFATRLLLATTHAAASSSTTTKESASKFPQPGLKADPFVQASPLICAVVCRDGVLVIAAHVNVDEQEPLLYYSHHDRSDNKHADNDDASFLDLPSNFQGPFRIHSIDTVGTCLTSAGWRADAEALVQKGRRLADDERSIFGVSPDELSPLYARYMAMKLSLHLAQCAVSERVSTAV